MSNPQTFLWSPSTLDSVCALQDVNTGEFLTFTPAFEQAGKRFPGFARTLLFEDKSQSFEKTTLVIQGSCNGLKITEELPLNLMEPTQSDHIFDTIQSIRIIDGENIKVSAGWGTTGRTAWFSVDYQRTFPSLSVQVVLLTGKCTYSLLGTLSNPAQVSLSLTGHLFPVGEPEMQNKTESALARVILTPLRYVCVEILESNPQASLEVIFLQQGI